MEKEHTMGRGKQIEYIEYPIGGTNAYLVFAGDFYYPEGGWSDLVGVYVTAMEAQAAVESAICGGDDWGQVIDLRTSWRWECNVVRDYSSLARKRIGLQWEDEEVKQFHDLPYVTQERTVQ